MYSLILKYTLGNKIYVKCFNFAVDGVNYIKNEFKNSVANLQTIVFLDINMPILNGWDVLDLISKMDKNIKKQLIIFISSSSIYSHDRERAMNHALVTDFIEKSLTVEKVQALFKLNHRVTKEQKQPLYML